MGQQNLALPGTIQINFPPNINYLLGCMTHTAHGAAPDGNTVN